MGIRELINAAKGAKISFDIAKSRSSSLGLKYMQIHIKNNGELIGTAEVNLSLVQDKEFDQKIGDLFIEHIERKNTAKGFRILELFISWVVNRGIQGVKRILCQTNSSYAPYYTKLGFRQQKMPDGETYFVRNL